MTGGRCVLLAALACVACQGQPAGTTGFVRHTEAGVTYYLAGKPVAAHPQPLAVFVQGTGCESHFMQSEGAVHGRIPLLVLDVVSGKALVLVVEKPGVHYLDDPADLKSCRPEFYQNYTLERWAQTIAIAIKAARGIPGVDPARTLVMGHSEGGIVSIKVSNTATAITHAASLAGGGPTYLFPSIIAEALKSKSALYFAQGSADDKNTIAGFDVLRAELAAKSRQAVFDRIEGGTHALDRPGQSAPEGLIAAFGRVVAWFGL
jgi:dienelactone hydrolase